MAPAGKEPAPASDHRAGREEGLLVYPVFSRRSGGLSVGINLFPDRKTCSFDCPYCEVFPFSSGTRFTLEGMERELREALREAVRRGLDVRDLCFSGNGEPTLSPGFPAALAAAARIRDAEAPGAALVLITNGSTLGDPGTAALLGDAARPRSSGGLDLDAWIKVDAGTEAWYRKIDRSGVPFAPLRRWIAAFFARSPATVQTMLCAVGGEEPGADEEAAWIDFVVSLAGARRVQLYGKARPAPEDPAAAPLPLRFLSARAERLRAALAAAGRAAVPVEVFE